MISTLHVARLKAWGAHGFTATGVVLAFLATLALLENSPKACLLWLGLALVVDGVDGSLARRVNVSTVLPSFDGSVLDLVIDYLTYVFIPALFIYRYIDLPDFTHLFTVSVILVSSLFCFCNVNMKSKDNYFVGFPAAWNVVALCVYIIQPEAWVTLLTVIGLALLTVTPMKFLHPFRVKRFMPLNIAVTTIWLLCSFLMVVDHPNTNPWTFGLWSLMSAYFLGICVWRTALEWLDKRHS
ncbi:CDP-alcohol phosphatidyltransferase family protein [Pseudomonas palleroniana]|uniref:phosphatidylcholine synthase n=1 Tax=Pseudomonas palleroniana TaxID=191390 RepID=UPI003B00C4F5